MARIKYDRFTLLALFKKYYQCTNKPLTYLSESQTSKIEAGVLLGASNSALKFKGAPYHLQSGEYESSLNLTMGIFADFRLLRTKRLTISNDLFYTSFNIHGTGFNVRAASLDTVISNFNYHFLKTHHQLKVNLTKNGTLYWSGGISLGIALKQETQVQVLSPTNNALRVGTQKFEVGYLAGLGYRLKNISIEIRLENSSSIQSSKTSRLYCLLKYRVF